MHNNENLSYTVKEYSSDILREWDRLLYVFSDYNLYQSYGWGEAKREGGWNVLRLGCYRQERCVGLLQALYRYYRFLGIYIIWVPGGPVFSLSGEMDFNVQTNLIDCLKKKFCLKKYYLRIYPMQKYSVEAVLNLRSLGFSRPIQNMNQSLTYHICTLKSETELLGDLTSNWRHNLRRSWNENFLFEYGNDENNIMEFFRIYQEITLKNGIRRHYTFNSLMAIKNKLPPFGRLNLFLCRLNGRILSGRIVCIVGVRAYDLLAAAGEEGRNNYASYYLMWNIMDWCRKNGIEYLDLSGVDPFSHKGIFNFKKGIGGNFVEYVGEWELSNSLLLRSVINLLVSRFRKD